MLGNEQSRIQRITEDLARGKEIGDKLIYDRNTKTIRPVDSYRDPDGIINISAEDATHYG